MSEDPPRRGNPDGNDDDDDVEEEEAWRSYESVFTNKKAGMDAVDRDKIKRVVYEASKNSAHFRNEQRKEEQTKRKIAELRKRARELTPSQLQGLRARAEKHVATMEATRDLTRQVFHVDMDAFYAAVHIQENPALAHVPMAVGGIGMISTANYKAREFGVRSAMPGFIALKLCPNLQFVRSDFAKYNAKAEEVRSVLRSYDPNFVSVGLDEATLDVTSYLRENAGVSPADLAERIRTHVEARSGLTCSVGGAANGMLAKICSDMRKPNGSFILPPTRQAILAFLRDLPIRKIPGIGKVHEKTLNGLGVTVAADLVKEAGLLSELFSQKSFDFFLRSGLGLGSHQGAPSEANEQDGDLITRKGISSERTFSASGLRGKALEARLAEIVRGLAAQMAEKGLRGRHMTVKMKGTDFVVKTKSLALKHHTREEGEMVEAAMQLAAPFDKPLRLIGVRMADFEQKPTNLPGQLRLSDLVDKPSAECGPGTTATSSCSFFCEKCNKIVVDESRGVHADWHLAREMQKEVLCVGNSGPSKPKTKMKPKAARKGMNTLDSLFRKRPRT